MTEVLVLSPSFGRFSPVPGQMLAEAGLAVRYPRAKSPLSSEQLQAEIGMADALIVGLEAVDQAALAAGPSLKAVAKHGVGVDNIDVAYARQRGIAVVNAPGANATAVADLVMGLLLAVSRNLIAAHQSVLAGEWKNFSGLELAGKTMGIVGLGRIGRAVARRAFGFEMAVLAHDLYLPPDRFGDAVGRVGDLDDLVRRSDVVSLHLPSLGSAPLIDATRLARFRPQSILINAARGDLVDEEAVADALARGDLRGYAADAFGANLRWAVRC